MTRHYPDLGSASDWLNQISHAARPIRNATQIRVVTRHQCGISALVSHTSISGETSGSVAKCRLFAQASGRASLEGPRSVNSSPKKIPCYNWARSQFWSGPGAWRLAQKYLKSLRIFKCMSLSCHRRQIPHATIQCLILRGRNISSNKN